MWNHPWTLAGAGALLALSYLLQMMVDARMDRHYSELWQAIRLPLRRILGF